MASSIVAWILGLWLGGIAPRCVHIENYVTSHLSGVCKGSFFAVPISSQNGAPKVHTAIEGPFCKVTSTVGVIFASLSAFESVSESVDVALTS